jgi:hypothetical protein
MEEISSPVIISLIALSISIVSLYFSYIRNSFYRKITSDEKLFKELVNILDRAYESFNSNDENIAAEIKHWRNSARYIVTYEKLYKEINTKLYKSLCNETEEFYRLKFHLLFSKNTGANLIPDYEEKLQINPISIAKIIAFSHRKHWKKDPLESINLKEIIVDNNLYSESTTFENFMQKHHKLDYERTREN